jgi:hypothetical protein
MLLNSVLAELAAQGSERKAHEADRGHYLAAETLFWVVFANSERNLRWLGSLHVPRPACAFGAGSPKGGYLSSSVR